LATAQAELSDTLGRLAEAQAKLKAVQEKIAALEAQFEEATAKKEQLAKQVIVAISDACEACNDIHAWMHIVEEATAKKEQQAKRPGWVVV
jgi:predicted  nucleic acid-binding Zn-ribbon protein